MQAKKLFLSLAMMGAMVAQASDEIPVVSAGVLKKPMPENMNPKPATPIPDMVKPVVSSNKDSGPETLKAKQSDNLPAITAPMIQASNESLLVMEGGANQIVTIAVGHPNRIVTPFHNPEVVSTTLSMGSAEGECGEVCIKDNVIYVATDKTSPVTMFITESGSEASALSLTMVPRRIPPREITLKLSGKSYALGQMPNARAQAWEQSQPYIDTIKTLFKSLAKGRLPQGYSMTDVPSDIHHTMPVCSQHGLDVDFEGGQYISGHNLTVFVGVAQNTSGQPVEFQEATCGSWDVAAVAAWPNIVLESGEKTEVYVVKKRPKPESDTTKRRSLLR